MAKVIFDGEQMNIFDKVALRCKMDWWLEEYRDYDNYFSEVEDTDVADLLEGYTCNPEMFADLTQEEKDFIDAMVEHFY